MSKYVKGNLLKILEIYLPDILDRVLEIFDLDELIEKHRYPEVYIYQSAYNFKKIDNNREFSFSLERVNLLLINILIIIISNQSIPRHNFQ